MVAGGTARTDDDLLIGDTTADNVNPNGTRSPK
jgi:hypothetical protein